MLLKPRFSLIYFSFLATSCLCGLAQRRLSGIITANTVWYLSVWLWQWPTAAFMVSKSHAIIKKIYSLAQILTRYRRYSTFLRTNKSASFITIIAFVFVVGASCCFVTSALTESCLTEDWLFPFLQTCLYTLHVIFVTSYSHFNAPDCIMSSMFFVQLVIAMEFMKGS